MFRYILAFVLAVSSVAACAVPKWTPIAKVGPAQLEVDTQRFNYITAKDEPAELNVIGYYRISESGKKSTDESVFWTNVKTCQEGRGKLVIILVPGTTPIARTWSKDGSATYDVIGQSLCAFHAAVKEQVLKDRMRGGSSKMI